MIGRHGYTTAQCSMGKALTIPKGSFDNDTEYIIIVDAILLCQNSACHLTMDNAETDKGGTRGGGLSILVAVCVSPSRLS